VDAEGGVSEQEGAPLDPTVQLIQELADAATGRRPTRESVRRERHELGPHLQAIMDNADVDELPSPAGRGRALKRMLLKANGFSWVRQRSVNRASLAISQQMIAELDLVAELQAGHERRIAAALAAVDMRVDRAAAVRDRLDLQAATVAALGDSTAALNRNLADLVARLEELSSRVDDLAEQERKQLSAHDIKLDQGHDAAVVMERRIESLRCDLATLAASAGALTASDVAGPVSDRVSAMYERFEAAFRPSDAELVGRMVEYIDDLSGFDRRGCPVIDIGAGRGEFLACLRDQSIDGIGVDLNAEAVEIAVTEGLRVECADALDFLRGRAAGSASAITALHVAEHLSQDVVIMLLDEALRVLIPGGLLLLETPNPTNVAVGAAAFYNDPSHIRPLTPAYLDFIVRDRGFIAVETRFLHPLSGYDRPLHTAEPAVEALLKDVQWALKGPQDFAVLARRPASG
jgi:SAM-dependent methyltransferase